MQEPGAFFRQGERPAYYMGCDYEEQGRYRKSERHR